MSKILELREKKSKGMGSSKGIPRCQENTGRFCVRAEDAATYDKMEKMMS